MKLTPDKPYMYNLELTSEELRAIEKAIYNRLNLLLEDEDYDDDELLPLRAARRKVRVIQGKSS